MKKIKQLIEKQEAPRPRRNKILAGILCVIALAAVLAANYGFGPGTRAEKIVAAYQSGQTYSPLEVVYPREGTVFPPDIAAPKIRWKDVLALTDAWVVAVGERGSTCLSPVLNTPEWTPSDLGWEAVKKACLNKSVSVTVVGVRGRDSNRILSAASITIRTSGEEVAAPVFYREVNLPFVEAVKDPSRIRWRFGPISSLQQPPVILENLPVCGNCHSFSADGKVMGMDVDYANDKGSYAISPVSEEIVLDDGKIITWSDYKRDDKESTFGLLSQVSPSGRYVVSTVKDRSVFVPRPDLMYSQLFFPLKGILAIYDRQTKVFRALPGADDPQFVQSNASWSPDEKYIVFARARAYELRKASDRVLLTQEECAEFLEEGKMFLYDLYRIPFNEGRGGTAEPLPGASGNGMSNYFPKYSPDGKWIVFCQAKTFMLLQPDSALYIIPASGGQARRLECNTSAMNSWHSWSPNGKWLVFSSKLNGPYTQLMLTHIDADGRSSPPVVLDRFTSPDRAANIPEFVALRPGAIKTMREHFVDEVSFLRAAEEHIKAGDIGNADKAYRRALEINPKYAEAHNGVGCMQIFKGNLQEAKAHLEKAIEYDPNLAEAYSNLGSVLRRQGSYESAVECFRKALQIAPDLAEAHNAWGNLLVATGKIPEAIEQFEKALEIEPDYASSQNNLGAVLIQGGQLERGIAHCEKALELRPKWADPHVNLAIAYRRQGKADKAATHGKLALGINPRSTPDQDNPALTDDVSLGRARRS